MSQFAANTSVPVEKSRAELETILTRYGASHFGYMTSPERASIAFQANGRRVQFDLVLPDRTAQEFTHYRAGRSSKLTQRDPAAALRHWEQACRQRWRALCLAVKAKLESVECGIATFEEEFLAHIVLPDGRRLGRVVVPQLDRAYETGQMPPLLGEGEYEEDER